MNRDNRELWETITYREALRDWEPDCLIPDGAGSWNKYFVVYWDYWADEIVVLGPNGKEWWGILGPSNTGPWPGEPVLISVGGKMVWAESLRDF